ncbi:hypothetical protein F5X97DRAFT_308226 [Nemania serpens]|nr:hypothetical protein F5X97DRAFT_308226 [Nemania serpens]
MSSIDSYIFTMGTVLWLLDSARQRLCVYDKIERIPIVPLLLLWCASTRSKTRSKDKNAWASSPHDVSGPTPM